MSRRILVMGLLASLAVLLPAGAEAGERDWRRSHHHGSFDHHRSPRHIVVPRHHDWHGGWRRARTWHHHARPHHFEHWRPHGAKVWYYRPGHGFHHPPVHRQPRLPFVVILKPWW